jgi:hypothetical protein
MHELENDGTDYVACRINAHSLQSFRKMKPTVRKAKIERRGGV